MHKTKLIKYKEVLKSITMSVMVGPHGLEPWTYRL